MNPSAAVLVLLLAPGSARAAQEAGLAGAYLNYAGGVRSGGMGRAGVALAEDTDAIPWNPAGLGFLRPNVLGFMHTQTVEQATLDYFAYAQPVYKYGGVGAAYLRLDSGSLPETDEYNYEIGRFRDVEHTVMVGYGYAPVKRWAVGGTLKYSEQRLAEVSASGWGIDLGALGELHRHLKLGARVQNAVAPQLKYETGTDTFPRRLTFGAATPWFDDRMVFACDVEKTVGAPESVQIRIGAEGTVWDVAKIRAGFDVKAKEFSFGLGYMWGRTGFDYSFGSLDAGFTHRYGMTHAFGGYPVMLQLSPKAFSPIGLNKRTVFKIRVNHSRPIHRWVLQIKDQKNNVVFSVRGSGVPPQELTWDGKSRYDVVVPAGYYACTFSITDMNGRTETTSPEVVRVDYGTPLDNIELMSK